MAHWRNDKAATITGNKHPTRCSYITCPSVQVSNDSVMHAANKEEIKREERSSETKKEVEKERKKQRWK